VARRSNPFSGWVVTRTGVATFAALLAAMIGGVVVGEYGNASRFARWLATDTGLFSYWFICGFVMSIAQMVLHVLGYPSARRK
jgi:hypothetical protein